MLSGMNERFASPSAASEASGARDAVTPGSVSVRPLQSIDELQRAERLLSEVWGTRAGDSPMPLDIMCALAYTGGYVVGAFERDLMIGVTAGFRTINGSLHSHVAGVLAPFRGLGVGRRMKQHQLDWAAAQSIASISWTFDPLIRRNAYFNLNRLGAVVEQFIPDFYGPLTDGINQGEATDRLFVTWKVAASPADPGARGLDATAFAPLLDVEDGETPVLRETTAPLVRIATPGDAEAMRQRDRILSTRWRTLMRTALERAAAEDFRIVGFDPTGCYLLRREGDGR